jgi:outer membrane protein OmpA-like peptidoglycan-associated protein
MKHLFILTPILISFFSVYAQSEKSGLFEESSVKMSEINSNTPRSDFGPAVIGDSLYFTSFRDEMVKKTDKKVIEMEFYDLYRAGIDDSGNVISKRQALDEFITRFHDGPVSWCAKTGELFITQSNYVDPLVVFKPFRNENIKLRIVVAGKLSNTWTVVEEFPYNNPKYSIGHPAINESGDTLFFSSDMPGGFGATDIYYSVRKNNRWGEPVNLGSQINTSEKEEFPFITGKSYSGRFLIFASTGHKSQGGFDLFYTQLSKPGYDVNQFSEPINTKFDDFSMGLPENVEYGYMTSNRPGTGDDDIYKLTFNKYIDHLLEIWVVDAKTLKSIPGALVNFCNKSSNKTGSDGMVSLRFKRNSVCDVSASAFGYHDNHKLVKIGTPPQGTVLRDSIFLDLIVNEKIVLRNIYYDFDKWDILPESETELDLLIGLMKENSGMKVELSSHTDERGTDQYNLKLSQKRAQSAVNYIVSKGIDQLRIKAIGYGESQLIYKSSVVHKCTPEEHRENRRTEIFIPGFIRAEPVKQVKGDFSK